MSIDRKTFFDQLPDIWHRLDMLTDEDANLIAGFLKRFLQVMDSSFERSLGSAQELLDLRSIDRIADRYLPLLSDIVGHRWNGNKTHAWNRQGIRDAIRRHSYKGARERVAAIIEANGGGTWSITDMGSKLAIPGFQGRLGWPDCAFIAADYYHSGAFVIRVPDYTYHSELLKELEEVRPRGERWFIEPDETDAWEAWSSAMGETGVFGASFTIDSVVLINNPELTIGEEHSEQECLIQPDTEFS
jgi:hypothetical protein